METLLRQRILLAPILVTPTKPLTPSHLKAFIWLDTMYKATALIQDVHCLYNRTTYDVTYQTIAFWAYLDAHLPDCDYSARDETWIGERYVEFHRSGEAYPLAVIQPYRERVEAEGWVHPASARILAIWSEHYRLLNLHLGEREFRRPFQLSLAATLARLADADVLLDLRQLGGAVFLDLTHQGLPLRQLIDEHGLDNYILCTLREVLPQIRDFDSVALLNDEELNLDYLLIERLLQLIDCPVVRMNLGRVPLSGTVQSSRHGGWQDYTFDKIIPPLLEKFELPAVRLGLRLYFIAGLGKSAKQSFRQDLLDEFIVKAMRILDQTDAPNPASEFAFLHELAAQNHGYVDPYRLTSALLSKRRPINPQDFLAAVFL